MFFTVNEKFAMSPFTAVSLSGTTKTAVPMQSMLLKVTAVASFWCAEVAVTIKLVAPVVVGVYVKLTGFVSPEARLKLLELSVPAFVESTNVSALMPVFFTFTVYVAWSPMQAVVVSDPNSLSLLKTDLFLRQERKNGTGEVITLEERFRRPTLFNVSDTFRTLMQDSIHNPPPSSNINHRHSLVMYKMLSSISMP